MAGSNRTSSTRTCALALKECTEDVHVDVQPDIREPLRDIVDRVRPGVSFLSGVVVARFRNRFGRLLTMDRT